MGYRWAVLLIGLIGIAHAATPGAPVYTYTGTAPSGACVGQRVWVDAGGTGTYYCNAGTWAVVPTAAGSNTQLQYNNNGLLAGSSLLTFSGGTLTLGQSAGSDAVRFATIGARIKFSSAGTDDYFTSDGTVYIDTPGIIRARYFRATSAAGNYSLYMNTGTSIAWSSGSNIMETQTGYLAFTANSAQGATFNNAPFVFNRQNGLDAIKLSVNGARIHLGGGTNDYLYSDGSGILTPGTLSAASLTLTTPLAGSSGGVGGVLPTCSGTDKLTSNGTTVSCSADQTAGGYTTVRDEGVGLTQRSIINFTGAGVSCTDNAGTTSTDCTITGTGGPSGSPGGSSGQIQYNNAGNFGGIANLNTDGTDPVFTGVTAHPAAPAVGSLKQYAFQHNGATGPAMPQWADGSIQFDFHAFPFTRSDDANWGCVLPAAYGSTAVTATGSATAGAATGTAAAVAWASTNEYSRHKWVNYPAGATTVNTSAGYRANVDYMWRGNAAGIGGFYWWGSFGINTTDNNARLFVGLKDATAVITATTDPSAALDTVYFGCDTTQTTLRICSNDNAGAATCVDLGANYPCTTTGVGYDVAFWAAPNASSIGYWISRIDSRANTTSGSISSDLPRNTVALGWDFWRNNGGTADANSAIYFGGACWVANP